MKSALLLLAAALPVAALGQSGNAIRWDYVAAGVIGSELDDLGVEIEGSTAVTENLVVFGSYRDLRPGKGLDRKTLQIGVGRRWNISANVDVMASLSYGDSDIDHPGRNLDEGGAILGGQIRAWAAPRVELSGALLFDNSFGSSTDVVVEFGGQFHRGRNVSYGGRIRADEDDNMLAAGIRFYFGASHR